jgi:phospho-N-acetylmuramoyl-pentapeptide-transferase
MNSAIVAILISFAIVAALCPVMIPYLKKLKFGQSERELGPASHFKKAGTPTMGGVLIVLAISVTCLFFMGRVGGNLYFAVIVTVIFGLIGFLDDYIKIIQTHATASENGVSVASLGMLPRHKLMLQLSVALALAVYTAFHPSLGTDIIVPFMQKHLDFGLLFIPFVVLAIVSVVNAVNLTDGLDGLAAGVTLIVFLFFLLAALSDGLESIGIFSASVIGACMGFLCYNFNPAKVFMGDTGSMALGGAVAVAAILTKTELFILIAGIIYVVETLSVALQVGYFKITKGKRLFKMAPIHHHFELLGWSETRIVIVFWAVSAVFVLISMLSLQ